MKKLIVKNTTRYPDREVEWLAWFAYRYVRSEAERGGWLASFDQFPVALRVTRTSSSYCGRFLGSAWLHRLHWLDRSARLEFDPAKRVQVWDVLTRVGWPTRFPCNSTYGRYKDMPEARLNDWCEAVVGIIAHELAHIRYRYQTGDRKGAEEACEWTEIDCVEQFRKGRSLFDEFKAQDAARAEHRQARAAAKRAPEAVLATELRKATERLANWERKHKYAATKVKHYTRLLRRIERKAGAK